MMKKLMKIVAVLVMFVVLFFTLTACENNYNTYTTPTDISAPTDLPFVE